MTAATPVPAESVLGDQYVNQVNEVLGGDLAIRVVGPESISAREPVKAVRVCWDELIEKSSFGTDMKNIMNK